MYPPGTDVYLYFDYKSTVTPSDAPESVSDVYLTLELENVRGIGNRPTAIKASEGTEFIGVVFGGFGGPTPKVDDDFALKLLIYGMRKNGQQLPSKKSDETLKFKVLIDGVAVISFEELKAIYRRLELLEKRLKELESRK